MQWKEKNGLAANATLYISSGRNTRGAVLSLHQLLFNKYPVLKMFESEFWAQTPGQRAVYVATAKLWHRNDKPAPSREERVHGNEIAHRTDVAKIECEARAHTFITALDQQVTSWLKAWDNSNLNFSNHAHLNEVAKWQVVDNRMVYWYTHYQALYALCNLGVSKQALEIAERISNGHVYPKEAQSELETKIVVEGTPSQVF